MIVHLKKIVRYKECKVRWDFQNKGKKTLSNHTYLNDSASKTFVATILVAYVTILSEPELSLQIRFEYQKKPYNQKIINREYTVLS